MKKLLFLILLVVLVSGCIDFGGSKASFGLSEVTNNPDVYIKIEASAGEIKSGRRVQLEFTVENRGDTDLNNLKVVAYDPCLFMGETVKEFGLLRANRSTKWNWRWDAGDTDFDRECTVRFRTTYDTYTTMSTTTHVLSEAEYYAREDAGTLDELVSLTTATKNNLRLGLSFSEQQPFLTGESIIAYINYNDVGAGLLNELEPGNVTIDVTNNLGSGECSSYDANTDFTQFTSNARLRFVSKEAPSTTCRFTSAATQPIESGEIRITAKYKYQFDNSLLLKVTPK